VASIELTTTQGCANFFQRAILGNLKYWHGFLLENPLDTLTIEPEQANIMRAITFGLEVTEGWVVAQQMIVILSPYMEQQGAITMWSVVLERAISLVEMYQPNTPPTILLQLLVEQAKFFNLERRYPEAIQCSYQGIELAHELADMMNEAKLYQNLAWSLLYQQNYQEAQHHLEQALILSRQSQSRLLEGKVLNQLGVMASKQGLCGEAIIYYEQAQQIFNELGEQRGAGYIQYNLGLLYYRYYHNYPKATEYYKQSLTIIQHLADRLATARILTSLGNIERLQGLYPSALSYYEQALQVYQQSTHQTKVGDMLNKLAEMYYLMGLPNQSLSYTEQALAMAQENDNETQHQLALINMGRALTKLEQFLEAHNRYTTALTRYKTLSLAEQPSGYKLEIFSGLAYLAYQQQNVEQAHNYITGIISDLLNLKGNQQYDIALDIYLNCYRVLGNHPQAEQLLQYAYNLVQKRASHIDDVSLQQQFLTEITVHHTIVQFWHRLYPTGQPG